MSHVIMMCGVCGSGKTTYARQKEKEGYVRLSIDEEMWSRYGQRGVDYPADDYDSLSEQVEKYLCGEMVRLIQEGRDVVMDFSFWNRQSRDTYRGLIQRHGAVSQLVYLKAGKDVLRWRLKKRNQTLHANSPFVITDKILDHHYKNFQEPVGEGELVLIQR